MAEVAEVTGSVVSPPASKIIKEGWLYKRGELGEVRGVAGATGRRERPTFAEAGGKTRARMRVKVTRVHYMTVAVATVATDWSPESPLLALFRSPFLAVTGKPWTNSIPPICEVRSAGC